MSERRTSSRRTPASSRMMTRSSAVAAALTMAETPSNFHHQSTTSTTSSSAAAAAPQVELVDSQARMHQLMDEMDHRRCSVGNQRALLAESLEQLRDLTKDLETDGWKFTSNTVDHVLQSSNGATRD